MNIELYRHAGFMGRSVPFDVLVNEEKEVLSISLPDVAATLQVLMQNAVSSLTISVTPDGRARVVRLIRKATNA